MPQRLGWERRPSLHPCSLLGFLLLQRSHDSSVWMSLSLVRRHSPPTVLPYERPCQYLSVNLGNSFELLVGPHPVSRAFDNASERAKKEAIRRIGSRNSSKRMAYLDFMAKGSSQPARSSCDVAGLIRPYSPVWKCGPDPRHRY